MSAVTDILLCVRSPLEHKSWPVSHKNQMALPCIYPIADLISIPHHRKGTWVLLAFQQPVVKGIVPLAD